LLTDADERIVAICPDFKIIADGIDEREAIKNVTDIIDRIVDNPFIYNHSYDLDIKQI